MTIFPICLTFVAVKNEQTHCESKRHDCSVTSTNTSSQCTHMCLTGHSSLFHQGAGNAFLNGNVNNKKSTILPDVSSVSSTFLFPLFRLVNNPSYGFLAPPTRPSFSCSLSPSQKGNWWTPV